MNLKHPYPSDHECVSRFLGLGPVSSPTTAYSMLLNTLLQAMFLKDLSSNQRGLKDNIAVNLILPNYVLSSKWSDVELSPWTISSVL